MTFGAPMRPVNAAAAKELSAETREVARFSCPNLLNVPVEEVMRRNPGRQFWDLTGTRLKEAEVVGLVAFLGEGKSLWAVRCGCNRYEKVPHHWIAHAKEKGFGWRCIHCKQQAVSPALPQE